MGDMHKKVRLLNKIRKEEPHKYNYLIEVDGGVNASTIKSVSDAGVDVAVAGSFIFKSNDYSEAIKILHNA